MTQLLERLTEGHTPTPGWEFGLKTTDHARRTANGHFWPEPGETTSAWEVTPETEDKGDPTRLCPPRKGTGLTVAKTLAGLESSGLTPRLILVVEYRQEDILARGVDKIRTRGEVRVVSEHLFGDFPMDDLALSYLSLPGLTLAHATAAGVQLRQARITSWHINGGSFAWANFSSANMAGLSAYGVAMNEASFYCANLAGAVISCCDLRDADFSEANLRGAHFNQCDLTGARFDTATMSGATYSDGSESRPLTELVGQR